MAGPDGQTAGETATRTGQHGKMGDAAAIARTAGAIAAALIAVAIILSHAGLAPAGQWQADEYFNFGLSRQLGRAFLRDRLLHWSPRPFSEALLYVYAMLVDRLHRPLIAPFLWLCWCLPLAAMFAGLWTRRGGLAGVMLPLSVFALLLLGHPVNEMFFWPMGAAPYLACLSGVAFVSLRLVRGGLVTVGGRIAAAAALILAAGSAELGILFAGCLCPLLALLELRQPGKARAKLLHAGIWLGPWLCSAALLVLLVRGRVTKPDAAAAASSPFYHHLGASLAAALRAMLGTIDHDGAGAHDWTGAAAALLSFVAITLCLSGQAAPRSRLKLAGLAACLFATALGSAVATFYELGKFCCERHETFRQCLLMLALVVLAAVAASLLEARRPPPWPGPALLACALVLSLSGRPAGLAHDYASLAGAIGARRETWRSAAGSGPAMVFQLPPKGRVVGPNCWPVAGHYLAGAGIAWSTFGLLQYFGKTSVEIVPAYNLEHR